MSAYSGSPLLPLFWTRKPSQSWESELKIKCKLIAKMLSENNNSYTNRQELIWSKLVHFLSFRFCKNGVEMNLMQDTILSRSKTKHKKKIVSKIALWCVLTHTHKKKLQLHAGVNIPRTNLTFPKEAELPCSLLEAQRTGMSLSLFFGISHF